MSSPEKEWLGESGYCNCLLVAMSRVQSSPIELVSNEPPPNLELLAKSKPDTCSWIREQEFDYGALNTSEVIEILSQLGGVSKSLFGYRPGTIVVHDVADDGPVMERKFHLRLKRSKGAIHLTITLDPSERPAPVQPARSSKSDAEKDQASAGRELRQKMLTLSPEQAGESPTPEFPHVYGILMDWPIGEDIATIFSTSSGAASLYTTSTFGIIGGEFHEAVHSAAIRFVKASDHYYDQAVSTTDYSYPASDRVRFYLLTYSGVRVIDAPFESSPIPGGKYSELFVLGQNVLTELRLITEKQQ